MKQNKYLLIILIIVLFYMLLGGYFQYKKNYNEKIENYNNYIKICHERQEEYPLYNINCDIEQKNYVQNNYDENFNDILYGYKPYELFLGVLFLIVLCSITPVCSFFKNKQLKNILTRTTYKKIKIKLFCNSLIPIGIYIFYLFLTIIITYLLTGSFNNTDLTTLETKNVFWPSLYTIIGNILIVLFTTNIALCFSRKCFSNIKTLILTVLTFIAIYLSLATFGNYLQYVINYKYYYIFTLENNIEKIELLIIPLILVILTTIILILLYKDSEKIMIDCDFRKE